MPRRRTPRADDLVRDLKRCPTSRELERDARLLRRRLLAIAYDLGRLEPEDVEFVRLRRVIGVGVRKLDELLRDQRAQAIEEALGRQRSELKAKLWDLYEHVPGDNDFPDGSANEAYRDYRRRIIEVMRSLAD